MSIDPSGSPIGRIRLVSVETREGIVLQKSTTVVAMVVALLVGSLFGSMVGSATSARAAEDPAAALAEMPSRAVVAFNRLTCPNGWSQFTHANGRVVVGLNPGGTLRARIGAPLDDKERLKHSHLVDPEPQFTGFNGSHSHNWATYSNGQWSTGSAGASFVAWSDGMDSAGSGFYPLAVDFKGSENSSVFFNTNASGNHAHETDLVEVRSSATWNRVPYVQLLMCIKD